MFMLATSNDASNGSHFKLCVMKIIRISLSFVSRRGFSIFSALTELRVITTLNHPIRLALSVRCIHKESKMDEKLFLLEKEKFLNMSQEQRRKGYRRDVLTLDKVSTWSSYYKMNLDRLQNMDKNVYINRFTLDTYETMSQLNDIVSIWKGDITKIEVDAIVNAANNSLLGGLGVDGAIHGAAGKFLYNECKILQGCETGDAKITGGYELPAKYVIHTVGPKDEKPSLLESCYSTCLKVLLENNLKTIAFPCISTGLYGYPQDAAACVALKTVRKFLESNISSVDRVVFCLFLEKDMEIYETLMQVFFPIE